MNQVTDSELIDIFDRRLPALIEQQPELAFNVSRTFSQTFVTKEEVAKVLEELRDFRGEFVQFRDETGERFDRIEGRLDRVEGRLDGVEGRLGRLEERVETGFRAVNERFADMEEHMKDGFRDVQRTIDRLGSRWGIRNESIFRQAMAELLEETFGYHVEEREIQGEQFDCVIHDGQHILMEISASVGPNIQERLERKRRIYTEATGVAPARVILVTAAIHSRRAQLLRDAGFEVIEPEEDTLVG